MNRRLWAIGVIGFCTATSLAAELPTLRTRPRPLPGIPCYPYRPTADEPRPTTTSASLIRVPVLASEVVDPTRFDELPLPTGLGNTPRPPVVFQLSDSRLQIEHCFVSRVAVTLYDDGRYLVSFRADQNPRVGLDAASPLRVNERLETVLQTTQLRRNLFVLRVRGYGLSPLRDERLGSAIGKPALIELPLDPFMVQRAEPYSGRMEGRSDAVRRSFELIDRVEVEFTYR